MSSLDRIRTIYIKELIDILRDRRTLIAMIVVPIVLYPLLMVGSLQAVTIQAKSLDEEKYVIGVVGHEQKNLLEYMLQWDAKLVSQEHQANENEAADSEETKAAAPLGELVKIIAIKTKDALRVNIRERAIHLGIVFESNVFLKAIDQQNGVTILSDEADVRGQYVTSRLSDMFDRISNRLVEQRKKRAALPALFDQPFAIDFVNLSAPQSILGQILPLILILMTITGAIYPAIDLTAGERERGTLESLMVCPVPVIDLIVGKFLVVTTVAIMGATLNLASVTATVYFGGFDMLIATSGQGLPLGTMLLILVCLIPFAVLMSAMMLAVCSFARTFKEAQNYVTPVILAALLPGGMAALPAAKLEGVMLVMPVGNMVLLTRELLLGAPVQLGHLLTVLLSTTLYAGAAVAIAATLFGKESVVFADSGSMKTLFSRKLFKPMRLPSVAMSLLYVSLLFPAWFFVQSALSPGPNESAVSLLQTSAWLMPLMFVLLPMLMMTFWKVSVKQALSFKVPSVRHLFSAILLGLCMWVPAHELNLIQYQLLGMPQAFAEQAESMAATLQALPLGGVILIIAIIPAVSEELLFRGFLMGGLSSSARKWTAIIASAAIFGVFHFLLFKFIVTATLGILLGYLCWQSRSIWPAIIAHALHNSVAVISIVSPTTFERMGIKLEDGAHLPWTVLLIGCGAVVTGLILANRRSPSPQQSAIVTA